MAKLKTVLKLFLTMLKIGAFTFGGGYAMVVLFEHEFVDNKKWLERDEFLDMIAIAESTPGPIAINSATYIGYKLAGVIGSVVATLGIVIPSLVIIYIISLFFDAFLALEVVSNAFSGIQVCVAFLILSAGVKMIKKMEKAPLSLVILIFTGVAFILFSLFNIKFSSIYFVLIGAGLGVIVYTVKYLIDKRKNKKAGNE